MTERKTFVFMVAAVLSACDGGGGGDTSPIEIASETPDSGQFNPSGPVINACNSPYYLALAGTYEGRIDFQGTADAEINPNPLACAWSVTVKFTTKHNIADQLNALCETRAEFQSVIIEEYSAEDSQGRTCDVINQDGMVFEGNFGLLENYSNPSYPVEMNFVLSPSVIAEDAQGSTARIYPTGVVRSDISGINFEIEDPSTIIYEANNIVDSEWSGSIRKTQ